MSDTWSKSRAAWGRLKKNMDDLGEHRADFIAYVISFCIMGAAIVSAFGWPGFWFCWGLVVWDQTRAK